MPQPLSKDLRERVIAAWQSESFESWQKIADTFGVGRATVNRWIRLFRETGGVAAAAHGGGVDHLIPEDQLLRVLELVEEQADRTVDELAAVYFETHGVRVSRATMGRALARLGLSRKKRPSCPPSVIGRASSKRAPDSSRS